MQNFKLYFFRLISIVAIGMLILSTISFIVYTSDILLKDKDRSSIAIFSACMALLSYFVVYLAKKHLGIAENAYVDDIILRTAISNNGLITATDLALASKFNIKEAGLQLERNFNDGLCGKRYAENSYVSVYEFERALSGGEKSNSKYINQKTI